MSNPYYRNSPFGPENWSDIYMARNYIRYMDSGKKPGCGWILLFVVIFIALFLAVFYQPNRHVSKGDFYTTGRIKSHAGLNIRSEPNSKATVLGTVPYNEVVTITDKNGPSETISGQTANWVKIEYDRTYGWVWSGFIEW